MGLRVILRVGDEYASGFEGFSGVKNAAPLLS